MTFLFCGLSPLICLEVLAQKFDVQDCLGSNRVRPRAFAAYTQMKIADWLDVVA